MDAPFPEILRHAIIDACRRQRFARPAETPYAFALIGGQCANYLGYAVATEQGLKDVADRYHDRGWRYEGFKHERFDNREKLATFLRWANPDDGWRYDDFDDSFQIQPMLQQWASTSGAETTDDDLEGSVHRPGTGSFFPRRALDARHRPKTAVRQFAGKNVPVPFDGRERLHLEEFCTDVLASLQAFAEWQAEPSAAQLIIGFTWGEDPRDFLRTATRANPYPKVLELWSEQWQAGELARRITSPSDRKRRGDDSRTVTSDSLPDTVPFRPRHRGDADPDH